MHNQSPLPEPSAPSLKLRASRGLFWASSAMMLTRLIQTVTTLFLAELLVPEDFGVIAVALLVINTLAIFRDMGLSQALIHRREMIGIAADTAFFVVPLLGLLMASLTLLAAPAVAAFFNISEETAIIRVLSIGILLSSLGLVPSTMLERELRFRRKFIPEVLPYIGYSIVTLTLAANGYGVWSLVAGELVRNLLLGIAVWPFSTWRPRMRFDRSVARELISYGRHVVGAAIAIFVFTTIDNAAIARGLGSQDLGFYVFAFSIGTLPASQISLSVGKVMFPAFASIQTDIDSLHRAFSKTISYVSAVAAPLALATLALGPVFLTTMYGDKWSGSVRPLQILAFYGLFRALGGPTGEILKATGRPRELARRTYFQLLLVVPLIYPALVWGGITGISLLFSSAILAGVLLATRLAAAAVGSTTLRVLRSAVPPIISAAVSAASSWFVAVMLLGGDGPFALMAGIAVFLAAYLCLMAVLARGLFGEAYATMRAASRRSNS